MATNHKAKGAPVLRLIDCAGERDAETQREAVSILKCLLEQVMDGSVSRLLVAFDNGAGTIARCATNMGQEQNLCMAIKVVRQYTDQLE